MTSAMNETALKAPAEIDPAEIPTPRLDPLFRPRSIAVIGASRREGSIGYQILDNLVRYGYKGAVYPVNPSAPAVHSIRTYPSVGAIPDPVDLAVIAVPAVHVAGVAEACGEAGVKAMVVITAGFREIGGAGVERERVLMEIAERYGMRVVGPNCMGVLNTDPEVAMNATFAPTMPPAGPVSFLSQSGALGVTVLDYATEYSIGISQFVSVGNKPDVSGNDLIGYWGEDDHTRVILMYLENFGNPRKFTAIARRTSRRKPIVVVKSGRSQRGARAASSHTGALAGADVATDALLAQCGVIRADTVEELFDFGRVLAHQPIPVGNRVAIVTNAGGPGILIADACEAHGLDVVDFTDETRDRLAGLLPEEASVGNPVDMIASANAEQYRRVIATVLEDENVDMVVASFVPPLGIRHPEVAEAIVHATRGATKPVVAVLMGREGLPAGLAELQAAGLPGFRFPESAVQTLGALVRYRRWLDRPEGTVGTFEVDHDAVREIIIGVRERGDEWLTPQEAMRVMEAYGIPVAGYTVLASEGEAQEAAARRDGPVVLKAITPDRIHKSEGGGVRVGLEGDDIVRAYREMRTDAPEAEILLQPMAEPGRELIVGMSVDPAFGPLLMFGLGGIHAEVLKDVSFRIHPVSDVDAGEMLDSIRGAAILEGVRGEPPIDRALVEEVIQRVSQLVGDHPEITELDINPFIAYPDGGVAVDARIAVGLGRGQVQLFL
jgi:acetate---CoA ligase (ADP-forming)